MSVTSRGREFATTTTGAALAYSPEYRFIGTALPLLREIAAAGGGRVLRSAAQVFAVPAPPVRVSRDVSLWLLGLAALLLPFDVAVRRLFIRPALPRVPARTPREPEPPDPSLARLRRRVDRVRTVPTQGTAPAEDAGELASRLLARRRGGSSPPE